MAGTTTYWMGSEREYFQFNTFEDFFLEAIATQIWSLLSETSMSLCTPVSKLFSLALNKEIKYINEK